MKKELIERMHLDSGCLITMYPSLYKKIISNLIKPFKDKKIDNVITSYSIHYTKLYDIANENTQGYKKRVVETSEISLLNSALAISYNFV